MQYIQYSKLKRIIKRKRFIADRDEAIADAKSATTTSRNPAGEYTPLQLNSKLSGSYEDETPSFSVPRLGGNDDDSDSDFFKVILSEIEKVNKFFVGYDQITISPYTVSIVRCNL